jgi:hypothetical protein
MEARLRLAESEIRADQARQQSQATAEQFLASQGIKFRVVAAKRGPGEWNVTFSRHGGGRLKLEYYQPIAPDLSDVVRLSDLEHPPLSRAQHRGYEAQVKEYILVSKFFTPAELKQLIAYREGQG